MNPANIFIVALIVIVLALIVASAAKKLFSKETCCGTSKETVKKKRLKNPKGSMTITVSGMKCSNCAARVTNAVNVIPGCAAKVNLNGGKVVVSYEEAPDEALIRNTIESLGYFVTDISA